MTDQDDQDWIDTLAGRKPAPGADPRTVEEAKALREAIRAAERAPSTSDFDADAGLQRLLFRLRGRNLLDARKPRRRWPVYAGVAATASLALAVGVVVMQEHEPAKPDDRPLFRGGPASQVLTTGEPAKLAAAIARDLERVGAQPTVVESDTAALVEADWPPETGPQHAELLTRYGLKTPAGTRLRIEIRVR